MQISRYTDYSLRTLIYLGIQPDRWVTIREIAEHYGISKAHLVKVVHQLGRHGHIETKRGSGGGMRLPNGTQSINIGNVVRDMENFDIAECFNADSKVCSLQPSCALKLVLAQASKDFLEFLDRFTLADLLPKKH